MERVEEAPRILTVHQRLTADDGARGAVLEPGAYRVAFADDDGAAGAVPPTPNADLAVFDDGTEVARLPGGAVEALTRAGKIRLTV